MKRKSRIILIIPIVLFGLLFIVWSSNKARQTSDGILKDFKAVDESLDRSNDSLQKVKDSIELVQEKKLH